MVTSLIQEYADSLAALTGNDFQFEVSARLQAAILGFQTIPPKPHGDAGLDAFSHNGQRGYCCYGPEHDEFKFPKERENAIVHKFKGDLRRVCELGFEKKKLVRVESPEMATILRDGCKLIHISLIVNWFESHRILSPLFSAFETYKRASDCRYVDASASLNVLGPKELANAYAVDESTILRARQRVFAQKVQHAAQSLSISDPKDFESKIATLREIRPDQVAAIDRLAEQFRADWKTSLAFERELDETSPVLHRLLEENRCRILREVSQLMIGAPEPWKELSKASGIAKDILDGDFGKLCGSIVHDVSSGEIARLIGECPVGWEKPILSNG